MAVSATLLGDGLLNVWSGENPILAFGRSVLDVHRRRVWSTVGHGGLPGLQLRLQFGQIDATERGRELGEIGAGLLENGLGPDEVAGREVVKRDGDLHHALIEGLGPTMDAAPNLFEDIVGCVVAALIDEVDAVLEGGGHG